MALVSATHTVAIFHELTLVCEAQSRSFLVIDQAEEE
jgi:hypothetical protein